jgi:mannose/fructose/N-acetylgalactosamine-specific phosphotransferase system component IID
VPKYRSALVVLTYTVIGGLVAKWTIIKVPFVLYTLTQGSSLTSYTVQEQLDNIMPNILPLMLTFLIYWLLQKKVSPLICMVGLMIFGVIGYSIGILGI